MSLCRILPARLILALDWLARDFIDQLLPQPVAGLSVDCRNETRSPDEAAE
jgi:hypothetical protein